MESSGSAPDVDPDDIRSVFATLDEPSTPLTAMEVAEEATCDSATAREMLERLVETGDLETRRVDETTQVWWPIDDGDELDPQPGSVEFSAFVDAVEDYAIFRLAPDGTVVSWNAGAERIKGYAEGEIVGKHFSTFYTEEDIDEGVPQKNLETAADEHRTEDQGWRLRADGTRFWAHVVITAVRDETGELQGFTKVTRDMTEQREYEQKLRQERDLIERIFDTVPVSIGVLDPDGRFVRANRRMLDRHGIDESDLDEFSLRSLDVYDADGDRMPFEEWPLSQVADTGNPVDDFQIQIETDDGPRKWLSVNAAPLEDENTDEDTDDDRIVAAVDDITHQKQRERQLRRERNQTEQLLRTAPIAIAVQNAEGETILANQRAQEALGLSEQEIRGEPGDADEWSIFDAEGDPVTPDKTPAARVLATGEPVLDEEIHIEPPDDDRMVFTVNAAPVFDADGAVDRVITAGEDITTLKERERQLERRKTELETELTEILDRISDAFYAVDDDWRFTHVNDRAIEILGKSREALLGERLWEVFENTGDGEYEPKLRNALDTQEPVTFEVHEARIDTWLEFSVYPSETGLSIYFRDVTDRKEHEQALREREQRLEQYKEYTDEILDAIDDIFYLLDEDGEMQRWNRTLATVTGYDDVEVASMHALGFFDESDQENIANAIAEGFETGDTQVEADVHTKDDEYIPYEFVATTLDDPDGTPVLAGIGRDISDRREYERKLEASNERLEQFAYAASHDLQEPLRMVSSYLQLVEDRYADALDEDGQEFIEFAIGGAQRMREMIDGLLEYSRVETEGDTFDRVDLDDAMSDARENLQLQIEETDAEITTESLPTVDGDRAQLRQVFQNLLDNAIEYSGDEPPRIDVSATRNGDEWVLAVHDEGIGIDAEDTERIFQVFQRLHTHEEYEGAGIGLALCRRIVERHGGDIWVDATPESGTTISFTLPASATASA